MRIPTVLFQNVIRMDLGGLGASGCGFEEQPCLQLRKAEQLLQLWIPELTIESVSERNGQQNPLYLGPDLT